MQPSDINRITSCRDYDNGHATLEPPKFIKTLKPINIGAGLCLDLRPFGTAGAAWRSMGRFNLGCPTVGCLQVQCRLEIKKEAMQQKN